LRPEAVRQLTKVPLHALGRIFCEPCWTGIASAFGPVDFKLPQRQPHEVFAGGDNRRDPAKGGEGWSGVSHLPKSWASGSETGEVAEAGLIAVCLAGQLIGAKRRDHACCQASPRQPPVELPSRTHSVPQRVVGAVLMAIEITCSSSRSSGRIIMTHENIQRTCCQCPKLGGSMARSSSADMTTSRSGRDG
jgi:hypothetical protein